MLMRILDSNRYINEKLDIKPITRARLTDIRKYRDFYNADNYKTCPTTMEETIYTLAYTLFVQRYWRKPNFEKYKYCIRYTSTNTIPFLFYEKYLMSTVTVYDWVKDIADKSTYDSALGVLSNHGEIMGLDKKTNLIKILPKIGFEMIQKGWDDAKSHTEVFLFDDSEIKELEEYIKKKIKHFTAYIRKDLLLPKYQNYANKKYYDNEYNGINTDLKGNEILYFAVDWDVNDDGHLYYIANDSIGTKVCLKFSDFMKDKFNLNIWKPL